MKKRHLSFEESLRVQHLPRHLIKILLTIIFISLLLITIYDGQSINLSQSKIPSNHQYNQLIKLNEYQSKYYDYDRHTYDRNVEISENYIDIDYKGNDNLYEYGTDIADRNSRIDDKEKSIKTINDEKEKSDVEGRGIINVKETNNDVDGIRENINNISNKQYDKIFENRNAIENKYKIINKTYDGNNRRGKEKERNKDDFDKESNKEKINGKTELFIKINQENTVKTIILDRNIDGRNVTFKIIDLKNVEPLNKILNDESYKKQIDTKNIGKKNQNSNEEINSIEKTLNNKYVENKTTIKSEEKIHLNVKNNTKRNKILNDIIDHINKSEGIETVLEKYNTDMINKNARIIENMNKNLTNHINEKITVTKTQIERNIDNENKNKTILIQNVSNSITKKKFKIRNGNINVDSENKTEILFPSNENIVFIEIEQKNYANKSTLGKKTDAFISENNSVNNGNLSENTILNESVSTKQDMGETTGNTTEMSVKINNTNEIINAMPNKSLLTEYKIKLYETDITPNHIFQKNRSNIKNSIKNVQEKIIENNIFKKVNSSNDKNIQTEIIKTWNHFRRNNENKISEQSKRIKNDLFKYEIKIERNQMKNELMNQSKSYEEISDLIEKNVNSSTKQIEFQGELINNFDTESIIDKYEIESDTNRNPYFEHLNDIETNEYHRKPKLYFPRAKRRLPQALIIGVRKCGTRALLEMLYLHPRIQKAAGEVHFFDRDENYSKGLEWYRKQMPLSYPNQVTIEKSPSYFVTPEAPERIFAMNSSVRLLLIVRDPVTRAISDYTQLKIHAAATSPGPVKKFEELALKFNGDINENYRPIAVSMYHNFMYSWLEVFPKNQILIVNGDRLIEDPVPELQRIEKFLNLEPKINHGNFYFNHTKGFYCLKNNTMEKCLRESKGRKHVRVHPKVISKMRKYFNYHNQLFYDLVEQDFEWPQE